MQPRIVCLLKRHHVEIDAYQTNHCDPVLCDDRESTTLG
jgi:hypothetical protein